MTRDAEFAKFTLFRIAASVFEAWLTQAPEHPSEQFRVMLPLRIPLTRLEVAAIESLFFVESAEAVRTIGVRLKEGDVPATPGISVTCQPWAQSEEMRTKILQAQAQIDQRRVS